MLYDVVDDSVDLLAVSRIGLGRRGVALAWVSVRVDLVCAVKGLTSVFLAFLLSCHLLQGIRLRGLCLQRVCGLCFRLYTRCHTCCLSIALCLVGLIQLLFHVFNHLLDLMAKQNKYNV